MPLSHLPCILSAHVFSRIPNWHYAHRKSQFSKPAVSGAKGKTELASMNQTVASCRLEGGANDF